MFPCKSGTFLRLFGRERREYGVLMHGEPERLKQWIPKLGLGNPNMGGELGNLDMGLAWQAVTGQEEGMCGHGEFRLRPAAGRTDCTLKSC